MEYATLMFRNSLLMIKQTIFNSKMLINDLIDSYNILSSAYK